MRSTLCTCLMLLSITGVYFVSCQTSDQQIQIDDLELDSSESSTTEPTPESSEESTALEGLNASHPKEPNAWFTRKLIMTSRQPSSEGIERCKERVESTANQATNLRSLEDISADLERTVSDNPKIYHWCFYQMMADLDNKLAKEAPLMDEKSGIFLTRMRCLWVLASALDATNGTHRYMQYLRARYTEISQNVFGRNLEIMNARDFRMPVKDRGKSASSYDE